MRLRSYSVALATGPRRYQLFNDCYGELALALREKFQEHHAAGQGQPRWAPTVTAAAEADMVVFRQLAWAVLCCEPAATVAALIARLPDVEMVFVRRAPHRSGKAPVPWAQVTPYERTNWAAVEALRAPYA
jgi:hypothetical protein